MNNLKYDDIFYKVWLSKINLNKKEKIAQLLLYFKDYQTLWNTSSSDLIGTGILNLKDIKVFMDSKKYKEIIRDDINKLKLLNGKIIGILDDAYPKMLCEIINPPPFLYVMGDVECLNNMCISIVGSRKASNYGLAVAKHLAKQLTDQSITVVSGLAYGIDSQAHWSVVENKGNTIAVLGSGIDVIYPSSNKELYNKIIESRGCIISEFCLSTQPLQHNFIYRNRIISGLSYGVIVVEAGLKSGSLITANYALEQGREVFAVPGNIVNYNSQGTNQLIKNGAKIVLDITDVLEEVNYQYAATKDEPQNRNSKLRAVELFSEEDKEIYLCLRDNPLSADELVEKLSLSTSQVYSKLTLMELQGLIELRLGKYFLI